MGKKKEKITYIDDGRTIADMSNVSGGWTKSGRSPYTPPASFREQWQTSELSVCSSAGAGGAVSASGSGVFGFSAVHTKSAPWRELFMHCPLLNQQWR